MSYTDIDIPEFGGLRLDLDPEEVGLQQAVNLVDVNLSDPGRLRQRDGTLTFATGLTYPTAITFTGDVLSPLLLVMVAWSTGDVILYDASTGNAGTTVPVIGGDITELVKFGTDSDSYVFYPNAAELAYLLNNTTFGGSGATGVQSLAVSPVDNRLAYAVGGTSKVKFSDAGSPLTYGANNFEQLDPGDGEVIQKLVTWRDQIFAFKQSKFFVFYGTSTDGTGQPIFQYRPYRSGVGVPVTSTSLATAGPDGVYIAATDGIYRTTGGDAVKVSQALDPWFRGEATPLASSLDAKTSPFDWRMSADQQSVFFSTATQTFVLDTQTGQWTLYGRPIYCAATDYGGTTRLVGSPGLVSKISPAYTDDDGTPIGWAYRTGLSDLGYPESKLVKQLQVWGSGTVTADVYADHATTDAGQTTLTLGSAPAVARATQMRSRQGTFFSVGLSGTGPATVNRAILGVAERRLAGVS